MCRACRGHVGVHRGYVGDTWGHIGGEQGHIGGTWGDIGGAYEACRGCIGSAFVLGYHWLPPATLI